MKTYDRQKAVSYARKWALNPNPNFYHFGGIGGDCTNFISQCLLAGGCQMNFDKNNGWYYNSSYDRSPSWTSVKFLQEFLFNKNQRGPKATPVSLNELEIGDIIQLRQNKTHFNHTVFVTKILASDILVCAHSNDALDRPLKSYNFFQLLPLHIIQTY